MTRVTSRGELSSFHSQQCGSADISGYKNITATISTARDMLNTQREKNILETAAGCVFSIYENEFTAASGFPPAKCEIFSSRGARAVLLFRRITENGYIVLRDSDERTAYSLSIKAAGANTENYMLLLPRVRIVSPGDAPLCCATSACGAQA